jgi:hypothetical protein
VEGAGCGADAAGEVSIWEDGECFGYSIAVAGEWEAGVLEKNEVAEQGSKK